MKRKIWIMLAAVAVVTLMVPTLAFAHGHYYSQNYDGSTHHYSQYSHNYGNAWCDGYVDSNGDSYCDNCGNAPDYCKGYYDFDANGICDHCEHNDGIFADRYGHYNSSSHHQHSGYHYGHHGGCCR